MFIKRNLLIFTLAFTALLYIMVLPACKGEDSSESGVISEEKINEPSNNIIKFNGRLFSLPSPVQISELIKSENSIYNKNFLNPYTNYQNYSSSFKQSLNLGIYGADLAYINIYEKYTTAASYFEVVKKLSQELNILNSFTEEVLQDIKSNKKNKDSLLFITSEAYRDADSYLIKNKRNDIGILILAGGWIESMHIISQTAQNNTNSEIINRIGQQKYALNNLIELMRPYYQNKSDDYDKLLQDLSDLALIFDGVVIKYQYNAPETLPKEQLTLIKSKTIIEINEYQLKHIREQIQTIRNYIIE